MGQCYQRSHYVSFSRDHPPSFRLMFNQHRHPPIYRYMYDHVGSVSAPDRYLLSPWSMILKAIGTYFGWSIFSLNLGVSHGDELIMLFKPHLTSPIDIDLRGSRDRAVSNSILTMWTNFAKCGAPIPACSDADESSSPPTFPEWTPVSHRSREPDSPSRPSCYEVTTVKSNDLAETLAAS